MRQMPHWDYHWLWKWVKQKFYAQKISVDFILFVVGAVFVSWFGEQVSVRESRILRETSDFYCAYMQQMNKGTSPKVQFKVKYIYKPLSQNNS